jgi:hypothetical protein
MAQSGEKDWAPAAGGSPITCIKKVHTAQPRCFQLAAAAAAAAVKLYLGTELVL